MVLGAAIVINQNHFAFDAAFLRVRERHKIWGEFKWTKVSNSKISAYKEFASVILHGIRRKSIHFHCLVVETAKIRNHVFNKGDRDLGLSKFFYQLLIKLGRLYSGNGQMSIYMDNRSSTTTIEELRDILNNGIRKRWKIHARPYKSLEYVDSHEHDLIQAVDLLIGSIAHFRNATPGVAGSSKSKQELAAHILELSGLPDFTNDSPGGFREFTVWNFVFPEIGAATIRSTRR